MTIYINNKTDSILEALGLDHIDIDYSNMVEEYLDMGWIRGRKRKELGLL